MSDEFMKRLRERFSTGRGYQWVLVLGIAGILLIGVSSCREQKPTVPQAESSDTAQYIEQMEERLERMVSSVRGAGCAEVMITLQNGVEYVYANEQKTNSDHTESESQTSVRDDSHKTVVTVDNGDGKSGLLVTEIQPVVRGVVVACEGAVDETVAALVSQAVCTALDITGKRVCVIPYNTERGS